ncbi:MAG TPA: dipeptide epimerase [Balneolaceae bacterium]|nr:dipeptide epimerase [Balneolaceae bacterium]
MSSFKLEHEIVELPLAQPFTIARGTKKTVRNVIVKLSKDGMTGYGEAAPNKRYDEDAEKVIQFLKQLSESFFDDIKTPEQLESSMKSAESPKSAQSAIQMSWLDWWGKSQHQPLWKLWEAPSNKTPTTSYTIGLDTTEVMQQKVEAAAEYPILKVKLGTDRDQEIIQAIREITDKPIRVDANEGWTSIEEAKQQISFLAEQNIEIVEQPMPSSMSAEMKELKQWSLLPLMADESFMGDENLDEIAECFDGINIKLAKIGSLVKAREVIKQARERDLKVMIGCMIESSVGISAGALLGTWADYVDLDGNLLIKGDPFKGPELDEEKRLVLGEQAGLGVRRQEGSGGRQEGSGGRQ